MADVIPARQRLSLDGTWLFQFVPAGSAGPGAGNPDGWAPLDVPGAWQPAHNELGDKPLAALYRRAFDCPADWAGQAACLHFGAADYWAEVWLNGARLGEHEGGYLPFEFEVGHLLRPGAANELLVNVVDPGDDAGQFPGLLFAEIPHGKQSWYGRVGGLWQSVWIERRAPGHITSLTIQPDAATGRVAVHCALSVPAALARLARAARLRVLDRAGQPAAAAELALEAGQASADAELSVPHPAWWSPDDPYLYRLEAELLESGRVVDVSRKTFGFRTIEARDGALFLNGQRLYLRGALDQDYYPGTFYTAPGVDYLESQLRQAKALGLNCLRCHIKVADPAYLEAADRLGVLIWAELPNWRHFGPGTAARARATLEGMFARDGHHPAIIIWTIINEGWGLELAADERQRAWLKDTYHWLKALDPTRLVVDNSACEPNFHLQTDLEDFHFYAGLPDHRRRWDKFVDAFANRPDWTFSPAGDAVRTGREPLLVSEFGNWGLPDVAGLVGDGQREPWWFETGLNWGDGVVYPHGALERFRQWSLDRVFGSYGTLAVATQWHEYAALKYEIETMRRRPEISGYVITEFTDVHWECNGLLDFQRRPKAFHSAFANINADTVILPKWDRTAYWAGEKIIVPIDVAHGAGPDLAGARLAWRLGDAQGEMSVPSIAAGEVMAVGKLRLRAPAVAQAATARLELELTSAGGQRLAANDLSLSFFPRPPAPDSAPLWAGDGKLAGQLEALGYALTDELAEARVIVSRRPTSDQLAAVRAGARLLLLAEFPESLDPGLLQLRLTPRKGTLWDGNWATSFAWVRRDGPWAALPGGPLLDFGFDRVIPKLVIQGLNPEDFERRVPAGLFVGWVHKPVGLIAARPHGAGRVVINTFRLLRDDPGADPVAATLMGALVQTTLAAEDRTISYNPVGRVAGVAVRGPRRYLSARGCPSGPRLAAVLGMVRPLFHVHLVVRLAQYVGQVCAGLAGGGAHGQA